MTDEPLTLLRDYVVESEAKTPSISPVLERADRSRRRRAARPVLLSVAAVVASCLCAAILATIQPLSLPTLLGASFVLAVVATAAWFTD